MDETQISITIRPVHIERIVYWILIIALAALVIYAWTRDCTPGDGTQAADEDEEQAAAPTTTTPPPATAQEEDETCVDGKKNQDESDVDCGGSCGTCGDGDSCKKGSDCKQGSTCTAGVCTAPAAAPPAALSGKVTLDLKKAVTQAAPGTGAIKIISVEYGIDNGLNEDLDKLSAKIFIKSKKVSSYCLNQQPDNGNDCAKPYAEFNLRGPEAGKTTSESMTISGKYIIPEPGYYDPTNTNEKSFNVVMYLYDQSGNEIGDKAVSDLYEVK